MQIIGLTGSIGMGKSTAAALLRQLGVPVYDADAAVHRLLGPGGRAVPAIERRFPGTVHDGAVDRGALGRIVFGDLAALRALEAIVHPLVFEAQQRFLRAHSVRRTRGVVLDIPLLFESGSARRCDAILVVSASPVLQRQRVLRRPGMTVEKLAGILAQQMPDAEKRRRADVVIPSGLGKALTRRRLRHALTRLGRRRQSTGWLWSTISPRLHRSAAMAKYRG